MILLYFIIQRSYSHFQFEYSVLSLVLESIFLNEVIGNCLLRYIFLWTAATIAITTEHITVTISTVKVIFLHFISISAEEWLALDFIFIGIVADPVIVFINYAQIFMEWHFFFPRDAHANMMNEHRRNTTIGIRLTDCWHHQQYSDGNHIHYQRFGHWWIKQFKKGIRENDE